MAGRQEVLASLLAPMVMVVMSVVRGKGGTLRWGCESKLRSGWRDIHCVRGTGTARHRGVFVCGRGINRCGRGVPPRATQLRVEARVAVGKGGRFV